MVAGVDGNPDSSLFVLQDCWHSFPFRILYQIIVFHVHILPPSAVIDATLSAALYRSPKMSGSRKTENILLVSSPRLLLP